MHEALIHRFCSDWIVPNSAIRKRLNKAIDFYSDHSKILFCSTGQRYETRPQTRRPTPCTLLRTPQHPSPRIRNQSCSPGLRRRIQLAAHGRTVGQPRPIESWITKVFVLFNHGSSKITFSSKSPSSSQLSIRRTASTAKRKSSVSANQLPSSAVWLFPNLVKQHYSRTDRTLLDEYIARTSLRLVCRVRTPSVRFIVRHFVSPPLQPQSTEPSAR